MNNREKKTESVCTQTTLESVAYEELKNALIIGIYPPGSQIIEEIIASQLDMSRSPVRSAIKRLEAEGFLEKHSNKRIYVTRGDARRTINILRIREALDGMTARLAALYRDEEDIARFRTLMDEMDACVDEKNVILAYRCGFRMHYAIYEASKNPELSKMAGSILEREAISSYRSLQQDTQRVRASQREHAEIVGAITAQKPDEAESLARRHIETLIRHAERMLEEDTLSSSLSSLSID
jgi:DNA-binding GntR family transcriptional regulator